MELGKARPPALRTGNGELRPLSSGTTLLTESDFCPRKLPYREGERVEKVYVCGEDFEEEREKRTKQKPIHGFKILHNFCLNVNEPFSDRNCCSEALRQVCLMVLSDRLEYAQLFG